MGQCESFIALQETSVPEDMDSNYPDSLTWSHSVMRSGYIVGVLNLKLWD